MHSSGYGAPVTDIHLLRPGRREATGVLGTITFEGEEWIEYGPPERRRRIGFHDYASLYDEPGLYDRVFVELLGMHTAEQVVGLYDDALRRLERDPAAERVIDLGAGSGAGGAELRRLGVGIVIGVDREPAAARATHRDRPGVYDDYVVAEVPEVLTVLRPRSPFTALVAVASVGTDALRAEQLVWVIEALLAPRAIVAFAVSEALFPTLVDEVSDQAGLEVLTTVDYVHRRQTDGTDHRATAFVGQRTG